MTAATEALTNGSGNQYKQRSQLSVSHSNLSVHSYLPDLDIDPGNPDSEPEAEDVKYRASSKGFRWLLVVCSFGVFSLSSITQITYGIFITELQDIFGLSQAMIGVIGAFRLSLSTMGGVVSAPIVPRLGCRVVAILGAVICTLGNFLSAFTVEPISFMLTFGLLGGLGAGMAYLPAQVIIQQHFQGLKNRAFAMGLASSGLSIGVMTFSPITRLLIDYYGWRGALLLISGSSLQMVAAAAMFRPPAAKPGSGEPVTVTTHRTTDGSRVNQCCRTLCEGFSSYFDRDLAKPSFILLLCGCFTIMFGLDTIYIRSAARAQSVGMDPVQASLIITASSPLAAVGRTTGGFIARCVKPRNLFGGGLVSAGTSIILSGLLAGDNIVTHIFFCAWFALSLGIMMGLQSTVVCDLVGLKTLPIAFAWVLFSTGVGRIIANPFIGFMYDRTGSYTLPFVFSGSFLVLGGICVLSQICIKDKAILGSQQLTVQGVNLDVKEEQTNRSEINKNVVKPTK